MLVPWCVETTTCIRQVDPAFLEPECGLAALVDGVLTVVSGTPSPSAEADVLRAHFGLDDSTSHNGLVRRVDVLSGIPVEASAVVSLGVV